MTSSTTRTGFDADSTIRMQAGAPKRFVFGIVAPEGSDLEPAFNNLAQAIKDRVDVTLERKMSVSYEALANDLREGLIDVAWIPPIVFVKLESIVRPIGSILRGGKSLYEAALVVRSDSRIRNVDMLKGKRAGWVDRWSASGFVWQRVKLALMGVDPRTLFRTEGFHGSHRAVVKALRDGACDVVGTWCRKDDDEELAGPWQEIDGLPSSDVHVVARFGGIPSDIIGVRRAWSRDLDKLVRAALRDICGNESTKSLVSKIFGGDELVEGSPPGYESLQSSLELASLRGLFD